MAHEGCGEDVELAKLAHAPVLLRQAWREAYEKIELVARAFPDGRMELSGTPPSSTRLREVVAVPRDEYAQARIGD